MTEVVLDLVLPRTDAGAIAQWVAASVVFPTLWFATRHAPDLNFLIGALALFTFAAFLLRAAH